MREQAIIAHPRQWVQQVVIDLNLCPFARREFDGGRLRFAVSAAVDEDELLADLERELQTLEQTGDIETTLLIHPDALLDFLAYN